MMQFTATPADQQSIIVRRTLPHGHVAAVLGTLRHIGLDRILGPEAANVERIPIDGNPS